MSKPRFEIDEFNFYPGTQKTINLSLPNLYDCTPMNLPIHVICGKTQGPTLSRVSRF